MRQIIDALKDLKGKYVDVYIEHKIFGNQHIKVEFDPEIEKGLGFRCKDQVIYVDKGEYVNGYVKDDIIFINGTLMSITIIK